MRCKSGTCRSSTSKRSSSSAKKSLKQRECSSIMLLDFLKPTCRCMSVAHNHHTAHVRCGKRGAECIAFLVVGPCVNIFQKMRCSDVLSRLLAPVATSGALDLCVVYFARNGISVPSKTRHHNPSRRAPAYHHPPPIQARTRTRAHTHAHRFHVHGLTLL